MMTIDRPASEVIAELGLPPDSQFVGYAIFSQERGEYLYLVVDYPTGSVFHYCTIPEQSLILPTIAEAKSLRDKIQDPVFIGRVFVSSAKFAMAFCVDD